jgi:hypothetical protein
MTVRVYCPTCENMVHPTDPHSCFSAAAHRAHKNAEKAVIEAAKEWDDTWHIASVRDCGDNSPAELAAWARHKDAQQRLTAAVSTLRALEGDA